jgi:AraC-like DNA-binding protein
MTGFVLFGAGNVNYLLSLPGMKDVRAVKEGTIRPPSGFIQHLLGADAEAEPVERFGVSAGIDLFYTDIIISPTQSEPEEMAYLNFYPIASDTYYLQLSFLPEYSNVSNEPYRIIQLVFNPSFFDQWSAQLLSGHQPFRADRSTEQAFTLKNAGKDILEQLLKENEQTNGKDFMSFLRKQEYAISLLRYALEAFMVPDEANKLPACGFLNNSSERDKVLQTQSIILANLETPMTIKALSREVGMNECYLKKGFKAMFGKTIHEYQQIERIAKAKELLAKEMYSINEVAFMMGFGSPSHFSTSFKKITGMKPCELLK